MGLNFRKSVKVAPGVKVNFGKKSVGVSVGNKYARKSVSTSGRKTTTIGTPVPGLSYTKTTTSSAKKETSKKSTDSTEHNYSSTKTYNPKTYKMCGIILIAAAIVLILMGLLLTIGEVDAGTTSVGLGFIFFLVGKSFLKKSKGSSDSSEDVE